MLLNISSLFKILTTLIFISFSFQSFSEDLSHPEGKAEIWTQIQLHNLVLEALEAHEYIRELLPYSDNTPDVRNQAIHISADVAALLVSRRIVKSINGKIKTLRPFLSKAEYKELVADKKARTEQLVAAEKERVENLAAEKARIENLAAENKKSIENLVEENKKSIENLAQEHKKSIENLEKEHKKSIEKLEEENKKSIENPAQKKARIEKLGEENKKSIENLAQEHKKSIEKLVEENKARTESLAQEKAKIEKLVEENKAAGKANPVVEKKTVLEGAPGAEKNTKVSILRRMKLLRAIPILATPALISLWIFGAHDIYLTFEDEDSIRILKEELEEGLIELELLLGNK